MKTLNQDKIDKIRKEATDAIVKNKRGVLALSMRSGKTKIAIDGIYILKRKKILWVTPEQGLRDKGTPDEFIKWRRKSLLNKTKFICYGSLKLETDINQYDQIVLDEIQHLTEHNSKVLYDYTGSMLGLTGTMPNDEVKLDIFSDLRLSVIYKLEVDEAVDIELVSDYVLNVVKFPMSKEKYIYYKSKKKYVDEKARYDMFTRIIYMNQINGKDSSSLYQARMHLMYGLKSREYATKVMIDHLSDKRGLIFTPKKAMTERLCKHFFHSTSKDESFNLFKEEKINLLGLVKKGGTGHTYKNLDFALIAQSTKDALGLTSQQWSRTLIAREGHTAQVYILCCESSVDETWVESAVKNYKNVRYDNIKNYDKNFLTNCKDYKNE